MSLRSMLRDTCSINSVTQADGGGAGITASFSTTTGVACTVQATRSTQGYPYMREMGEQTFRVFFEFGTSIKVGDTITWGTRTLHVRSNPVDPSGRSAYVHVDCVEQSAS